MRMILKESVLVGESTHHLYDLPVVPDGTAQNHAEDHPNDLKSDTSRGHMRTGLMMLCDETDFNLTQTNIKKKKKKTYHDSCNTDPNVSNDVELLIEEVRYCNEAVLKMDKNHWNC